MVAKIQGLDRLKRKLDRMPAEARKKVRDALAKSADEIVSMQKNLAPKDTGALADSIVASTDGEAPAYAAFRGGSRNSRRRRRGGARPGDDLTITITAGNDAVRYAHLVEFGTAAHTIEPRNAQALGKDGSLGARVDHPGSQARPFFYPAWRANKKRASGRVRRAVRQAAKDVAKGK